MNVWGYCSAAAEKPSVCVGTQRSKRPSCGYTAEKHRELTPPHSITWSAGESARSMPAHLGEDSARSKPDANGSDGDERPIVAHAPRASGHPARNRLYGG